jgi:flagellar biosynthesis/type III secretory pathway M-ring protein FliF/YscJ
MTQATTQTIIWLAVFLAIALTIWAIVRENERRRRRTVEEWERDFAAGQGLMNQFMKAGALGLESFLTDERREAIEFMQDEQQGMTKTGTKGDDEGRTAVATDGKD